MKKIDRFEDQIRECYGRVVYTHKTHEKMADRFSDQQKYYKIVQILLTALTSLGAIGVIISDKFEYDQIWIKVMLAFVSFLALLVSTYLKNFDLGGLAQKHRDTAIKIWNVRESYLSLLTDMEKISEDDALVQRDKLQSLLSEIYASAPQTDSKAYMSAQSALKDNEEFTFTTEEIDCFLPKSLKKNGSEVKL
ncbi:MAG: SLATT domain-containing protein [Hyphomicrobiales bacterium]